MKNSFALEIECNGSKQFPRFCDVPINSQKFEFKKDFDREGEMEYLIVKESPISILSDLIDGQKSLKRLKLIGISVTNGWEWGPMFAQFNRLVDFHLEKCSPFVDELVINGSADKNNMISFSVNKCGIKSIKTDMITEWIHLKIVSLAHNCIHELDRHWFPSQLESLWFLDLSYNKISWIPDNYFLGLTALRKLRLDNNSFVTLNKLWFHHIWEGLHELWIDGEWALIAYKYDLF